MEYSVVTVISLWLSSSDAHESRYMHANASATYRDEIRPWPLQLSLGLVVDLNIAAHMSLTQEAARAVSRFHNFHSHAHALRSRYFHFANHKAVA